MINVIRERLRAGLGKLRWLAELIGQRIRAESALIRLLGEAYDLDRRRDDAAQRVGYRLLELWDEEGINVFEDPHVAEALSEARDLLDEINGLKEQASLINEISEVEQ